MGTHLIIVLPPLVNLVPGILQRQEPMGIEAFLPQAPIEAFHLGIVGRFVRTAEVELDPALICPLVQGLGRELRAVVTAE